MNTHELKNWRETNGYSQAALAKKLGVAVMTVSRWETGTRSIPPFLHLALSALKMEGGGKQEHKGQIKRKRK